MINQIKKFTIEFFSNLKCQIEDHGDFLVVSGVPKNFEDLFGYSSPYKLTFDQSIEGHYVGKGSQLLASITKFLEGSGKNTLLKIDFDIDVAKDVREKINLKNCEIKNFVKKYKNNFFYRFTFLTTFRYLNNSEQLMNEIYVHNGKVVTGDLSGYTVLEGKLEKVPSVEIKNNYEIARTSLKEKLDSKTEEIGKFLENKTTEEILRINEHYDNLFNELGGDLSETIKKIEEIEIQMRTAEEEEIEMLKSKRDRLRKNLIKTGDDEARNRILKEKNFTIKDAMQKYSLNIDNKLINTTVIYYPILNFNLYLAGENSTKFIEMSYDPLTKVLEKIKCESCGKEVDKIMLCGNGHVSCDDCLTRCGECRTVYCKKCLTKSCAVCGKPLCKDCAQFCFGCGKYVCKDHFRKDCVSGEERCTNCLRPCLRCHGMAQEKYFGEAIDGSKVCQKCLGVEARDKVMKKIFQN